MIKGLIRNSVAMIILSLLIASCGVTRTYEQPATAPEALYRNAGGGGIGSDTASIAMLPYTAIFGDPILQQLISEGLSGNLNLQTAYTRVAQAQAYYRQSRAAFFPTLNANANAGWSRVPEAQGGGVAFNTETYNLGLSSSWEIDIWGKLAASRRASLAALLETDAASRAIQTSVVSTVANYYYLLLALDEQLLITRQTVSNWDTTMTTMRALKEAAMVTEAAVVQSEAQRYAAEVTIPDLEQRIRETENALSIFIGRTPGPVRRGRLQEQQAFSDMNPGIPAQLLANRPDVQQAEFAFRNAFELTNVARTAFYPALVLTGTAGLSSTVISSLFDPGSIAAGIAGGLTQPIFNRRQNRTNLEVYKAGQRGALFHFQNVLLTAGQEVSNALSLNDAAREKMRVRALQLDALGKAVDYTEELLKNGFANYTEVIQARQSLLAAQLNGVNDRLQQLQAVVDLYRALGGGWR